LGTQTAPILSPDVLFPLVSRTERRVGGLS
jgi:hypothetical protein